MRVLVLTGMYPTPADPAFGHFVSEQVESLRQSDPDLRCDVLFFNGRASRLNYLRAALELRRRVRARRYDLVHAHYGLAGVVAAMQTDVPVLLTLHGSDVHVPWQRALTRLAVRGAEGVILVSERMKPFVQDVATRGLHVIPCGVDTRRFRPAPVEGARARLRWRPRVPMMLFPGDPARRVKRYEVFQEVLRAVRRAGFSVEEATLKGVAPERVPDIMNACDVMVMTSRWEGSPVVIKEAMACDLPIVSVDVGDVAVQVAGANNCAVVSMPAGAEALAGPVIGILERGERSDGSVRVAGVSHQRISGRILDVYRLVASTAP